MKIEVNKIPPEGFILEEETDAKAIDLDTQLVRSLGSLKVRAEVSRITNAVTAVLNIEGALRLTCGRCLADFKQEIKKNFRLSYPVEKNELFIDLNPDIREEIIIDYPLKALCKSDCRGLCHKCGKNLNLEQCDCGGPRIKN